MLGFSSAATGPCGAASEADQLSSSCHSLCPRVSEGVWAPASYGMFLGQPWIWPSTLICLRLQAVFILQTRTWVIWPVGLWESLQVGALVDISKIF